jgi:hypothetical protein
MTIWHYVLICAWILVIYIFVRYDIKDAKKEIIEEIRKLKEEK